jgi:hypothetical protein
MSHVTGFEDTTRGRLVMRPPPCSNPGEARYGILPDRGLTNVAGREQPRLSPLQRSTPCIRNLHPHNISHSATGLVSRDDEPNQAPGRPALISRSLAPQAALGSAVRIAGQKRKRAEFLAGQKVVPFHLAPCLIILPQDTFGREPVSAEAVRQSF